MQTTDLCSDCPPVGYPTDETRCTPCPRRAKQCKHVWRTHTDWMGDPDVINGTVSWTVYECTECGEETTEKPDDYDPNEGRDPDHEREMRQEDREFLERYNDYDD